MHFADVFIELHGIGLLFLPGGSCYDRRKAYNFLSFSCLHLCQCRSSTHLAGNRHMTWWKERIASVGSISDLHDGKSWKAEAADPVMNQEGEVQVWLSDCGDGADPCAGKHRGPQSVFFSAKRYFNAMDLSVEAVANEEHQLVHCELCKILFLLQG